MMRDLWERLDEAFARAMEVPSGERDAFAVREFGDEPALLAELRRLLRATKDDGLVDRVVGRAAASLAAEATVSAVGRRVGPYLLVEEIGAGGMGTVYLAERADAEFDRRVAIKLVRGGAFDEIGRVRFRVERQILAGLEHPNIARMLDGGTTEDGMPYVVMEYVEGVPIHEYADERRLTVRQRLDLVMQVLRAVEYAHRNLVIHRDLKPGNILVTSDGVPKLLDFGIAKLLAPDAPGAEPTVTLAGARPMTPEYASPEQIAGRSVGITADVYSLGILLHRLLTGRLPYDLTGRSAGEVERIVSTREPERPSRMVDARGLRRVLRGDLDVIVLKALRKEPERRYGSVAELADDIERFLTGHPVVARAPTLAYRARKFARRNVVGVAAALVLLVGLSGGLGVAVAQARAADRARQEAEIALARSAAVTDYLTGIFWRADPRQNLGEEISVREALDRGREELVELDQQPVVKAELLSTLGTVYDQLGAYPVALDLRREAVELRRGLPDTALLVGDLNRLGIAYNRVGHNDSSAIAWQEAFDVGLDALGPSHDGVLAALGNVGVAYARLGREADAERAYRQAVELEREALDPDDPTRAFALNNLGLLFLDRGDYDEAEPLLRETLRLRVARDGERHPESALAAGNLGLMLREAGRYDEAEPLLRRYLAVELDILGPAHPRTAEAMLYLGEMLALRATSGDLVAADTLLRQSLEAAEAALGARHEGLGYHLHALGLLQARRNDLPAAEAWFQRALALRREIDQDAPRETVKTLVELSAVQRRRRNAAAALTSARDAVALADEHLTADHPVTGRARVALALSLASSGDPEAPRLFEAGIRTMTARIGGTHPLVREACEAAAGIGLAAAPCSRAGGGRVGAARPPSSSPSAPAPPEADRDSRGQRRM